MIRMEILLFGAEGVGVVAGGADAVEAGAGEDSARRRVVPFCVVTTGMSRFMGV